MTNLLATIVVCLVTNVTTSDNAQGCGTCEMMRRNPGIALYHQYHNAPPFAEATMRLETTEVVELIQVTIDPKQLECVGWVRGALVGEQKKILSRTVRRFEKTETWKEVVK